MYHAKRATLIKQSTLIEQVYTVPVWSYEVRFTPTKRTVWLSKQNKKILVDFANVPNHSPTAPHAAAGSYDILTQNYVYGNGLSRTRESALYFATQEVQLLQLCLPCTVVVELLYLWNSQDTTFSGTTHVTKRYRNYTIGTLIIKSVSALTQWTVGVQNVNVEFYSFHQSKISINRAGGATCWTLAPEVPSAPIKSQLSHAHPALGVMQLPSFNLTTPWSPVVRCDTLIIQHPPCDTLILQVN